MHFSVTAPFAAGSQYTASPVTMPLRCRHRLAPSRPKPLNSISVLRAATGLHQRLCKGAIERMASAQTLGSGRVQGLGFRILGFGFWVYGLGFRV